MPKSYKVKVVKAAKAGDAHEILVHGPIGGSFWSDDGITGKDFTDALNAIPKGEKVTVGINSQGGAVGEGLAVYNAIQRRSADITCRIDGYALSIASFFPLAASKVISPKSAIWMIHQAWSVAQGNSDDMRDAAGMLDTHDGVILGAYTKKTGKSESEMRQMMADETWMSGEEALALGLADEEGDGDTDMDALDFSQAAKAGYRRTPDTCKAILAFATPISAPHNGPGNHRSSNTPKNLMKKEQILALLKKHGITVPENATDEQLLALVDKIPTATASPPPGQSAAGAGSNPAPQNAAAGANDSVLMTRIQALEAANSSERRQRVTTAVQQCVDECRIPVAQREAWVTRCLAEEALLADLHALPQNMPGGDPVSTIETVGEDPRSIDKAVVALWGKPSLSLESAYARAQKRAQIISANIGRIAPVWNTNTISTDLKLNVILQTSIRAFAIRVLPLTAFSTVFSGIRLAGTDKVAVPYWPLDTTASTDFVAGNGYDTFGNTNADAKAITVNKRKYQGLSWTSSELSRQPYIDINMSAQLKGEQLAIDCVNDVLSLVTLATFGASVKAVPASAFFADDAQDLKGVADLANWPAAGRSMLLNSAYDVNLLKDAGVKSAYAWGDNAPIREGRIVRISGFDYMPDARIPSPAGENLQGFICWKSAILVAFAPIGPTPEVRSLMTRYEVVVEPTTGVAFEYRLWGDPNLDKSKEVIEANYGSLAGEVTALKRITSA